MPDLGGGLQSAAGMGKTGESAASESHTGEEGGQLGVILQSKAQGLCKWGEAAAAHLQESSGGQLGAAVPASLLCDPVEGAQAVYVSVLSLQNMHHIGLLWLLY